MCVLAVEQEVALVAQGAGARRAVVPIICLCFYYYSSIAYCISTFLSLYFALYFSGQARKGDGKRGTAHCTRLRRLLSRTLVSTR